MFRPFSQRLFQTVLDVIQSNARKLEKPIMVIYTERAALDGSFAPILAAHAGFHPVRLATYRAKHSSFMNAGLDFARV